MTILYNFHPDEEIHIIKQHIKAFFGTKFNRAIIGISGGKDSMICAKLISDILGKTNVTAVLMPNGFQEDIEDAKSIIQLLGLSYFEINIHTPYYALCQTMEDNGFNCSDSNFMTNTPARIRMTTLYGISACIGGIVINTCNLSEDCAWGGFSTLFGDNAGGYAPIQGYTVTEVRKIGVELGLPKKLVYKEPDDGMCGSSDEEKISKLSGITNFTYERFDRFIRNQEHDFTEEEIRRLWEGYRKGKFKTELVRIPHYVPSLPFVFDN